MGLSQGLAGEAPVVVVVVGGGVVVVVVGGGTVVGVVAVVGVVGGDTLATGEVGGAVVAVGAGACDAVPAGVDPPAAPVVEPTLAADDPTTDECVVDGGVETEEAADPCVPDTPGTIAPVGTA